MPTTPTHRCSCQSAYIIGTPPMSCAASTYLHMPSFARNLGASLSVALFFSSVFLYLNARPLLVYYSTRLHCFLLYGARLHYLFFFQAFPGGRPSFCISLDKHGPYDFVSYARIAAGLPAFPSPPPVEGEPFPSRGVDEPACQWAAEGICEEESGGCFEECSEESSVKQLVEPSVHERWEDLRHDSEGLRAVVTYLEMRLSKYPQWGSDGGDGKCSGGDGGSCAGSGGRSAEVATDNDYGACGITTVEEETRVSSERRCPVYIWCSCSKCIVISCWYTIGFFLGLPVLQYRTCDEATMAALSGVAILDDPRLSQRRPSQRYL